MSQRSDASNGNVLYEILFNALPFVFYKDASGIYVSGNDNQARAFGFNDASGYIGKNIYEILNDDVTAERIEMIDAEIMQSGQPQILEEVIGTPYGQKIFLTQKHPIRDIQGNVAGLLAFATDITEIKAKQNQAEMDRAQIQAENHRLEIEHYKQIAAQQERFQKQAHQVAHDIRSPLSAILMTLKACDDIPEPQRVALREAANRISDIANNLINAYKNDVTNVQLVDEQREAVLVSSALLEILTEKKYEYQDRVLKLEHRFSSDGNFAWVNIKPGALKRMISNLINNSIEAFDGYSGHVSIGLDCNADQVFITIKDNGKGMSLATLQKIKEKVPVTAGKSNGYGIGMTQVQDTLDENDGQIEIESVVGEGTRIVIAFPRVAAKDWIADSIRLYDDDTVVVLDDDVSIHQAWNFRLESMRQKHPGLTVIHHHQGKDTIDYFNRLNPEQKQKVFLLSDYELLKQGINGLDVITKVETKRSLLVTSYYSNRDIQTEAMSTGTLILPKQLAAEVPIFVRSHQATDDKEYELAKPTESADVIFIDDDKKLLDVYKLCYGKKYRLKTYDDPKNFLDEVSLYTKRTKIFVDQNYTNYPYKGEQIIKHLSALGYSRLYLITGDPTLLTQNGSDTNVLIKSDLAALNAALSS